MGAITVGGIAHHIEQPVIPEPEVRATPVVVRAVRARTGTLKKVTYEVTVKGVTSALALPQSANTMVKAILSSEREWHLHVSYARGHWVDASGEPRRSFTWEYLNEWTDPSPRYPQGQQKKTKIWGGMAPPVDSILVRATLKEDGGTKEVLSGHWVDSEYESGGRWSRSDGPTLLDWTSGLAKALKDA